MPMSIADSLYLHLPILGGSRYRRMSRLEVAEKYKHSHRQSPPFIDKVDEHTCFSNSELRGAWEIVDQEMDVVVLNHAFS